MVFYVNLAPIFLSPNLSLAFLLNDCVCVCVCVCVSMGNLYANSISIIGSVLSEKLTVNRMVRFVLNLRCVPEKKMDR